MKRRTVILCLLVLGLVIGANVLTPSTWQWGTANLQVEFHNVGNERRNAGSYIEGAGWSKVAFFSIPWEHKISRGTSQWGGVTTKRTTECHIAGVSPKGVSVRVRHTEDRNGTPASFDQVIFIPTHGTARVDVSPDFYLTGSFE